MFISIKMVYKMVSLIGGFLCMLGVIFQNLRSFLSVNMTPHFEMGKLFFSSCDILLYSCIR